MGPKKAFQAGPLHFSNVSTLPTRAVGGSARVIHRMPQKCQPPRIAVRVAVRGASSWCRRVRTEPEVRSPLGPAGPALTSGAAAATAVPAATAPRRSTRREVRRSVRRSVRSKARCGRACPGSAIEMHDVLDFRWAMGWVRWASGWSGKNQPLEF